MSDLFLLTRILLKNNYTPLSKDGKKKSLFLRGLLLVLCEVPFGIVLYFQFRQIFEMGLTIMGLQAGFFMLALFSLFTVLFAFPTVFYFSRDISFLLPLPVPSWTIAGAKFLVVLASQAMVVLVIAIPLWLAWITSAGGNFLQGAVLLLQTLMVPLDTMLVLGILTIAAMAFMPGTVNKDRFNLVVGVFALVFAVCISMMSSTAGASVAEGTSQSDLMIMLQQNPQFLEMGSGILFQCLLAIRSVGVHSVSLLWTLLSIGLFVLLAGLFVFMAARFYISSASAAMMSVSTSKRKGKSVSNSAAKSYFLTRFRLLYRTPAYVTNLLMGCIIMPLIFLAMAYFLPALQELREMTIRWDIKMLMPFWTLLLLIGMICGFFNGSVNGICATSFSRDGQNLGFYKTIPMSMKEQMRVRLFVGFLPSLIGTLLMIPVIHHFIVYNPVWDLFYALGCVVTTLFSNQIGLLIDACHPKLVWDDETASVKNNLNTLYELFLSWIFLVVIAVPSFFLIQITPWAALGTLVLCVIAAAIMEYFLETTGVRKIMEA